MFLLLTVARATTWTVDPAGGGDATTVQGGIALAATGDTVQVAPGTYAEDIDFQARTFVLEGDGSSTTWIVGSGAGPVVRIDSGEGPGTAITGFTVQGGNAAEFPDTDDAGGGLYSRGVPLAIEDLVFVDNIAVYGGGALVGEAENIDLRGSVFSGNRSRYGGGLYVLGGSATVQDCAFDGNTADLEAESGSGGALLGYQAAVTGRDLTFIGNGAVGSGGAVYMADAAAFTCTFCDLVDGSATLGGGIYASDATVYLTSTSIDRNVGTDGGGGIAAAGGSAVTLYAVSLDDNDGAYGGAVLLSTSDTTATYLETTNNTATGGGGFYVQQGTLTVTNGIFAGNVADAANGGGIAFDEGVGILDAVVFSNNFGYSGGAAHVNNGSIATFSNVTMVEGTSSGSAAGVRVSDGGVLDLSSSIIAFSTAGSGVSASTAALVTLRYNDFWSNASGNTSGGLADPTGTTGNISENPLFVSFAQDGAWSDDLHLAAGSPCIDAGDAARFDADGTRADMGAYGGANGAGWGDVDQDVDGYTVEEGDCDDTDSDVHPGAFDGCDDIDQDCDGTAREGCDTGSTAGDDTGPTDNTDDTDTRPDDTGPSAGGDDSGKATPGGCGCATGTTRGVGFVGALTALMAGRRRR